MRRAIGLLVAGLFAALVLVPTAPVTSASVVHSGSQAVGHSDVAQPPPPTTSAPAGPELNPEQAPDKSRQKLIIGFFAAVLVVIVFFGRRARNKSRKKAGKATVN